MSTHIPKKESKLTGKQVYEIEKAKADRDAMIRPLWERSEDILSILRRATPSVTEVSAEVKERWYSQTESPPVTQETFNLGHTPKPTPETWFERKFHREARRFGKPFLYREVASGISRKVLRPEVMNEDFFAAMLGGEKGLGHRIVYCPGDGFWFWDPVVEAFCPTSDAKMKILLSNYLVKYGEAFSSSLDVSYLYKTHRKPGLLKRVVNKAKAVLEADESFFRGELGQPGCVDGKRIVAQQVASPLLFVQSAVTRQEGAMLTASEAYLQYGQFCEQRSLPRLPAKAFKDAASKIIYGRFQQQLRHDIPTSGGGQTHGWKHVAPLPVDKWGEAKSA